MRTLYSFWKGLVNLGLIFLPIVILVVFTVQYGQPFVELYQNYFLGNPIHELTDTTNTLVSENGRDVPYQQLERQYNSVSTIRDVSDTGVRSVRESILRVHRSVVKRLGTGDLGAVGKLYSDSYSILLRNSLVDKVFSRPDIVRNRLRKDLFRLESLRRLPSHPARGLDSFWNSADTTVSMIEEYGNLYANQLTCRQIFSADCSQIYQPSANLTGQYIAQYLANWPRFSRSLEASPTVFNNKVEPLYRNFVQFQRNLQGYLRASPWSAQPELDEAYQDFVEKYQREFQEWYGIVLDSVSLTATDFSSRQWNPDYNTLADLRSAESKLNSIGGLKELLLTEKNKERRNSLLEQISKVYAEVTARDHFDPEFEASEKAQDSLQVTLRAFPGGERQFQSHRERIAGARTIHRDLMTALNEKDYDRMLKTLTNLSEAISDSKKDQPWQILTAEFLSNSRDTVARPEWQPTTGEKSETYREIIKRYGRLGRTIQLAEVDQSWVDQTLLALKSRRFNQLKHEIRESVAGLDEGSSMDGTIVEKLGELRSLQDLPEKLSSQVPIIIVQSAMIEYLDSGRTRLKQEFSSVIESKETFRQRWEQLVELRTMSNQNGTVELEDYNRSRDYIQQWKAWLTGVDRTTELGKLLLDRTLVLVEQHIDNLTKRLKDDIRSSAETDPSTEQLQTRLSGLAEALTLLETVPDYEVSYDLTPWKNVLLVRTNLFELLTVTQNLSKGSLFGSNPTYESYVTQTGDFDWKNIPTDYSAKREIGLLREVWATVNKRARSLNEATRGDWLPGWGGRITGRQVLTPWTNLLKQLRNQVNHSEVSPVLNSLLTSAETLEREITRENG